LILPPSHLFTKFVERPDYLPPEARKLLRASLPPNRDVSPCLQF
jgi:hypothetical protein